MYYKTSDHIFSTMSIEHLELKKKNKGLTVAFLDYSNVKVAYSHPF